MSRVVLIAASGLARETLSSIRQTGVHEVIGVLDDAASRHGTSIGGAPILGGLDLAARLAESLLVCAGPGPVRSAIVDRLGRMGVSRERYATHIDSTSVIGDGVTIGVGTIILAGCVLTCDIVLGDHVVLMPRVVLTHDDTVGDFATFAAGVSVGGRTVIGRCAYLGMNSSVRQDLTVGERSVLGMGAVLVRSLPDRQTWAGTPAKPLTPRTDHAASAASDSSARSASALGVSASAARVSAATGWSRSPLSLRRSRSG